MDPYGTLFRSVLYPTWESKLRGRPTLARLDYLERTQWRSLDEILAIQLGSLRRLLQHAYENVPFYKQRLTEAGIVPSAIQSAEDLRKLPVLTRQDARTTTRERTSLNGPKPTLWKTTGGTTGEPLVIGYEADSEYWRQAIRLRGYGWAGHKPGERSLHYWGFPTRAKVALQSRIKIQLDRYIRREHYVDCTLRGDLELMKVVELIRRERPTMIVCYTQAGGDLARFVNRNKLRTWGDIAVICGAERVFAHDRDALQQAFGPGVFETYGCREVMLIGSECQAHNGLHESMENVLVELIVRDANGKMRAAREGELGEVLLTDLHNYAMPFIRYANGDMAIAGSSERCSCGRALRRISAVEGRMTETLRDAKGNRVSGMIFNLIFSALAPSVRQFQAVQHKDGSVTLRVIPGETFDSTALDHIRLNCEKYLHGINVRVEHVADIPISKSGKRMPVVVEQ